MSCHVNQYGQAIGESLENWTDRAVPEPITLRGKFCRIEPMNPHTHTKDLYDAYDIALDDRDWTYLPATRPHNFEAFKQYIENIAPQRDPKHYVVVDNALGKAVGFLTLMRIDSKNGVIEEGYVTFSPLLMRKPASRESHFLLLQYVFDELKYRRYEWKCDSLNYPSRKAAERLGFTLEGIFRQATIYNSRSRDTAWYSIIDKEWPQIKKAFQKWLSDENFDNHGVQFKSLADIRKHLLK